MNRSYSSEDNLNELLEYTQDVLVSSPGQSVTGKILKKGQNYDPDSETKDETRRKATASLDYSNNNNNSHASNYTYESKDSNDDMAPVYKQKHTTPNANNNNTYNDHDIYTNTPSFSTSSSDLLYTLKQTESKLLTLQHINKENQDTIIQLSDLNDTLTNTNTTLTTDINRLSNDSSRIKGVWDQERRLLQEKLQSLTEVNIK